MNLTHSDSEHISLISFEQFIETSSTTAHSPRLDETRRVVYIKLFARACNLLIFSIEHVVGKLKFYNEIFQIASKQTQPRDIHHSKRLSKTRRISYRRAQTDKMFKNYNKSKAFV